MGLKGNREALNGIEGKEGLRVELSGTVTRNGGGDGDVTFVVADAIYEEEIPNSPTPREVYKHDPGALDNKSSWSQESSEVVRWRPGRPRSASWSTINAQLP